METTVLDHLVELDRREVAGVHRDAKALAQ